MKVKERIREETANKLTFPNGCINIKNKVEVGTAFEGVR